MSHKIKSLAGLGAALRAREIGELAQPGGTSPGGSSPAGPQSSQAKFPSAEQLYALARNRHATGSLGQAGDSLRTALSLGGTSAERRRLFQERLTAIERMGSDPELATLNEAIARQFQGDTSVPLLVRSSPRFPRNPQMGYCRYCR
jgi:hypothetical protein